MSNTNTTNLLNTYFTCVKSLEEAGADADHVKALKAMALSDLGRGPDVIWSLDGQQPSAPAKVDPKQCSVDGCSNIVHWKRRQKGITICKSCETAAKAAPKPSAPIALTPPASPAPSVKPSADIASLFDKPASKPSPKTAKPASGKPKVWEFKLSPVAGTHLVKVEPQQNLGKRWGAFRKRLEDVCGLQSFRYISKKEAGEACGFYMDPAKSDIALAEANKWANHFDNGERAIFTN